ncbi:hypothetical protein ACIQ8G_33460 [Streptomyces sp. NPDC094154]|uniref:hypothetical protein n=1 Tax=Streptomyces sp. NPDC094154 TaxID=3366059 RepID=UPI003829B813
MGRGEKETIARIAHDVAPWTRTSAATRPGLEATSCNWLGVKRRSSETLPGLVLMGVRLYNPATGRFLSPDTVYGGNANAYE